MLVAAGGGSDSDGSSGSGSDADDEAAPEKKPKGKPAKAAAGKAPAAAAPEPMTDVSAWDVFGLHPGITRALAMQVTFRSHVSVRSGLLCWR